MLNDKQVARLVKGAVKERLYIQEHEGEYLITNAFWLFKVNSITHKKTMQELAKIFLSLPQKGENKGIIGKEIIDNVPNLLNLYENTKASAYCHDLKPTKYLYDQAKILINNEFAVTINNDFFQAYDDGELKCNGRFTPVCIFDNGELEGIIMPLKFTPEEHDKFDKLINIAA